MNLIIWQPNTIKSPHHKICSATLPPYLPSAWKQFSLFPLLTWLHSMPLWIRFHTHTLNDTNSGFISIVLLHFLWNLELFSCVLFCASRNLHSCHKGLFHRWGRLNCLTMGIFHKSLCRNWRAGSHFRAKRQDWKLILFFSHLMSVDYFLLHI